jgi:hypothetical protein
MRWVPFKCESGDVIELDLNFHHFKAVYTSRSFEGNRIQYFADAERALRSVEFGGGGFVEDIKTGEQFNGFKQYLAWIGSSGKAENFTH